jgi:hypothetical protein
MPETNMGELQAVLTAAHAREEGLREVRDRVVRERDVTEARLRAVEDALDDFPVDRTYSVFGAVAKFKEHVRRALADQGASDG